MTIPWSESQDGDPTYAPLSVIIEAAKPGVFPRETPSLITSYGFTFSRAAGQATPEQLLGEDPLRIRALITTNVVYYIGNKKDFSTVTGTLPSTGTSSTGMRVPTAVPVFEVKSQDEIWVAYTAPTELGVWVERRVPGGTR